MECYKIKLAVIVLIATVIVKGVDAQSSCTTLRGETGTCVPILTCGTITDLLNSSPKPLPPSVIQLVQRSHCGTFSGSHYVCCERNRVTGGGSSTPTPTPPQTPVKGGSGSVPVSKVPVRSNAEIQSGMNILEAIKCGKSYPDRVANGEDAELSEFPWMALLVYDDGVSRTLDCGGSLITDRYVLTAAHCIRVGSKKLVSVRLGEHDTKETTDCAGTGKWRKCAPPIQEIDIEETVYHKDYNPSQFSDDIGLIRLISKAAFHTNIQPICLPITPESKAETLNRLQIAGWGRIENGLKASVLQKAVVPLRDNDFCQRIHKVIKVTDKQLCAGAENKIDTCKGDSGGPLFYSSKYRRGTRYVQYGVVSAGSSQCGSDFPGVYVKVTAYLPWIAGNLRP